MKGKTTRAPNIRERFFGELILLGGEVLSRAEMTELLTRAGVPPKAIDICVYGARTLSDEDILQFSKNSLVLALRLRCYALGGEIDE
jgi:hypothetical protein